MSMSRIHMRDLGCAETFRPDLTVATVYGVPVPKGIAKYEEWDLPLEHKRRVGWLANGVPHWMDFDPDKWPNDEDLTAMVVAMRMSLC